MLGQTALRGLGPKDPVARLLATGTIDWTSMTETQAFWDQMIDLVGFQNINGWDDFGTETGRSGGLGFYIDHNAGDLYPSESDRLELPNVDFDIWSTLHVYFWASADRGNDRVAIADANGVTQYQTAVGVWNYVAHPLPTSGRGTVAIFTDAIDNNVGYVKITLSDLTLS